MNILLVEDTDSVRQLLARELARRGDTVVAVPGFRAGASALHAETFGAVIIDMCLPDGDGRDLVVCYRALDGSGPAVIITASRDHDDRALALESGADGVMVKPFGPRELLATLEAITRRRPADGLVLADLVAGVRGASVAGLDLDLTEKELALARSLLLQRGRLVARNDLIRGLWGPDADPVHHRHVLSVHLHNLRAKLKRAGSRTDLVSRRRLGVGIRVRP